MPMNAEAFHPATEDPVSNVLKWILLTGSSGVSMSQRSIGRDSKYDTR